MASCETCQYAYIDEETGEAVCDLDLDEDEVADYFTSHFEGDCLLAVGGDGDPIKIHFHTNEPWKVLEYCRSLGEIYDIVVEDMIRQARGEKG